jgi:hypothetical protein
MLKEMKETGISVEKVPLNGLRKSLEGKTLNGVLFSIDAPEFSEEYHRSIAKA